MYESCFFCRPSSRKEDDLKDTVMYVLNNPVNLVILSKIKSSLVRPYPATPIHVKPAN